MSEGGIGWIPFLLDRIDRHVWNHSLDRPRLRRSHRDGAVPEELPGVLHHRSSALHLADRIGVEAIAWECDYPHSDSTWPTSPEALMGEVEAAHLSDPVINQITWENACRFFRFDPFGVAIEGSVDGAGPPRAQPRGRYQYHLPPAVPGSLRGSGRPLSARRKQPGKKAKAAATRARQPRCSRSTSSWAQRRSGLTAVAATVSFG